jgi:hypothetical protein
MAEVITSQLSTLFPPSIPHRQLCHRVNDVRTST